MSEKRVKVWVQRFKDRPALMLQWIDPATRKRKSVSAGTADEDEAEAKRVDLEADLNACRYHAASKITWEKFREIFEDEYVSARKANTQKTFTDCFERFERLCSPTALRGINERMLSLFATRLRKEKYRGEGGYAPVTIKVTLQYLQTTLNWAVGQKLIADCPTFPVIKVPKKKPQPIPAESFERLILKAKDQQMKTFLLVGWLAGLRLSEALALEWEPTSQAPYLDFARRRIILPAEFVKAVEDQWLPLDPVLAAALAELPREGKKVFNFIARHGRPLKRQSVSTNISRLAKKAGVRLTMHSLRKGFGCRYAGKVPAQVLQKLMRHSKISTTMDYYANVDEAVETAVFGDECNSSRNSDRETAAAAAVDNAAKPLHDGSTGTNHHAGG
jgi:integrase